MSDNPRQLELRSMLNLCDAGVWSLDHFATLIRLPPQISIYIAAYYRLTFLQWLLVGNAASFLSVCVSAFHSRRIITVLNSPTSTACPLPPTATKLFATESVSLPRWEKLVRLPSPCQFSPTITSSTSHKQGSQALP